ncbi:YdhR family protein [Pseudonocardia spirodelae]|uniref:YdhR family protein n=1 Tax=Pseudonocardia spirodelae TaxID=3133431 RepID=A0ABU8T703_9PSEU
MQTFLTTHRLDGITDDEHRALCGELAPAFAELPGLLATIWLADPASGTYGGVHLFGDSGAADAFVGSRLFRTVVFHPHLADMTVRRFTVDEATTRRTQPGLGVVPTRAVTLWPTRTGAAGTRPRGTRPAAEVP